MVGTDLGLCGLSVCPPLKRIAQPGGRDAPASPSLLTDSPAVETSSYSVRHTKHHLSAPGLGKQLCGIFDLVHLIFSLPRDNDSAHIKTITNQRWPVSEGAHLLNSYWRSVLNLTWASLTSSCLYLLTMSLVRFNRKPDTVSNSWSTVSTETLSEWDQLLTKRLWDLKNLQSHQQTSSMYQVLHRCLPYTSLYCWRMWSWTDRSSKVFPWTLTREIPVPMPVLLKWCQYQYSR